MEDTDRRTVILLKKKIKVLIAASAMAVICMAQTVCAADWVDRLDAAQTAGQIITVVANGSSATLSMHNKDASGHFVQVVTGDASIGRNGLGKTMEGDGRTPRGKFGLMFGFGNRPDPGSALQYVQIDRNCYWVDDPASAYYNRFVSTLNVQKDWRSAENLLGAGQSYNYALALDYNAACVPGAGSAIFIHCRPTGGAGCVAVNEDIMLQIMKNVQPGCVVLIDDAAGILNY